MSLVKDNYSLVSLQVETLVIAMFVRDGEGIPVVPFYDRLAGDVAADSEGFDADGDMLREPLRNSPWTLDRMGIPVRIGVEKSEFLAR